MLEARLPSLLHLFVHSLGEKRIFPYISTKLTVLIIKCNHFPYKAVTFNPHHK